MHTIKEKLKQIYIPFNTGTFALFISLLALGYVASATNTPCISAQSTCAIGSTNEFTGNISLKGGTTYNATLDASNITADRNIELPDADGELMIGGGLSASKVVATDVSGDLTTTDIYPLSLSASKSLSTDGSGNVETNDIYPLSLTASKSLSTDGSGNVETNDIYPLSLTASTPLKTNGTGEVTASDLDITTDITPGSALQEIRVNAGGTALEYFTPSGGTPDSRIVAQGSTVASSTYTGMEMICWYGQHTLDKDKNYKLIFNGGTYNIALSGDSNYWRPQQGDCTSGGGSYFANNLNYWVNGNGPLWSGNSRSTASTFCRLVQSTNANTSSYKTSNLSGEINLRPWRPSGGYGFFSNYNAQGVTYNSINSPDQIQTAIGGCQHVASTISFSDMTGLDMQLEGNGTSSSREWVLYEYDY